MVFFLIIGPTDPWMPSDVNQPHISINNTNELWHNQEIERRLNPFFFAFPTLKVISLELRYGRELTSALFANLTIEASEAEFQSCLDWQRADAKRRHEAERARLDAEDAHKERIMMDRLKRGCCQYCGQRINLFQRLAAVFWGSDSIHPNCHSWTFVE